MFLIQFEFRGVYETNQESESKGRCFESFNGEAMRKAFTLVGHACYLGYRHMKKTLWCVVILGWLGYGVYRINDYFTNMEPPSEVGQMILDSMEVPEGWLDLNIGRFTNPKLNLVVEEGVWFANALMHSPRQDIEGLTRADRYWINNKLRTLRNNLKQIKDNQKNQTEEKAKEEFVPNLKESLKRSKP